MKLSRVNSLLLVVITVINGYTLLAPLVPQLLYVQQKRVNPAAKLEQKLHSDNTADMSATENRLIIPALGLDQQIHEGKTAKTLSQGLWHRPNSGTPDQIDNTVISGHRFTYDNPQGTLYHLNKVHVGDIIGVIWNGQPYRYKVTGVKTVKATDTSVEAPTTKPQLTIYTCTPLWLPKDRLVLIAEPESTHE